MTALHSVKGTPREDELEEEMAPFDSETRPDPLMLCDPSCNSLLSNCKYGRDRDETVDSALVKSKCSIVPNTWFL